MIGSDMKNHCKIGFLSESSSRVQPCFRKGCRRKKSPEGAGNTGLHPQAEQAGHSLSAWLPDSQAPQVQVQSFPGPISASKQPRVLLSGSASQQILEHLTKECHICNILALVSPDQTERQVLEARASTSSLGNELALRCWHGDIASVLAFQGPFDVIYLTGSASNAADPYNSLLQSCLRLKPGGVVIVYCSAEREGDGTHGLAFRHEVLELAHGLPLEYVTFSSPSAAMHESQPAIFQKPWRYGRSGLPLELEGAVVEGFGRGSKQLGFPTANLDPAPLQDALAPFPTGVYWGYADVGADSCSEATEADLAVVNIGQRPTYGDSPAISIEAHVLRQFSEDFYGKLMKLSLHGFIRPEIKFSGLEALVDQIKTDIGAAKAAAAS